MTKEALAMDKYPLKEYPIVGVCGLNCGLCPRYHTAGVSRCPGCCGPDFGQKHPACGFITCCVKERGLETCAQCNDLKDCDRLSVLLDSARYRDSFLSHRPIAANLAFIQEHGIEQFAKKETAKVEFLRKLIDNYDDGRAKGFYCISCQLVPLDMLKTALKDAEAEMTEGADIKERAKIVRAAISSIADSLRIDLKLRR